MPFGAHDCMVNKITCIVKIENNFKIANRIYKKKSYK